MYKKSRQVRNLHISLSLSATFSIGLVDGLCYITAPPLLYNMPNLPDAVPVSLWPSYGWVHWKVQWPITYSDFLSKIMIDAQVVTDGQYLN